MLYKVCCILLVANEQTILQVAFYVVSCFQKTVKFLQYLVYIIKNLILSENQNCAYFMPNQSTYLYYIEG